MGGRAVEAEADRSVDVCVKVHTVYMRVRRYSSIHHHRGR